jgi:heme oxygenase
MTSLDESLAAAGPPAALLAEIRERTKPLHTIAERTGIVKALLHGEATRRGYALLLRNLLPVYQAMEIGLDRHGRSPGVRHLALPAVYRAHAIEADLDALYGASWRQRLPMLPAGARYAAGVAAAAEGNGAGLIGHAYTRYLGDLSGGQVIRKQLALSLGLEAAALSFYDFPAIDDPTAFKREFRAAMGRAEEELADLAPAIDAAVDAFRLNIELSEDVLRVVDARDVAVASQEDARR